MSLFPELSKVAGTTAHRNEHYERHYRTSQPVLVHFLPCLLNFIAQNSITSLISLSLREEVNLTVARRLFNQLTLQSLRSRDSQYYLSRGFFLCPRQSYVTQFEQ